MDHNLWPGFHDGIAKRSAIEHIDNDAVNARGFKSTRSLGMARAAGDLVPGRQQERRQPTADSAAGAGKENPHAIISLRAIR
jgi:hypothetical protein